MSRLFLESVDPTSDLTAKFGNPIKSHMGLEWKTEYGVTFINYNMGNHFWGLRYDKPLNGAEIGMMDGNDVLIALKKLAVKPNLLLETSPHMLKLQKEFGGTLARHSNFGKWQLACKDWSIINNPFGTSLGYCDAEDNFEIWIFKEKEPREYQSFEMVRKLLFEQSEKKVSSEKMSETPFTKNAYEKLLKLQSENADYVLVTIWDPEKWRAAEWGTHSDEQKAEDVSVMVCGKLIRKHGEHVDTTAVLQESNFALVPPTGIVELEIGIKQVPMKIICKQYTLKYASTVSAKLPQKGRIDLRDCMNRICAKLILKKVSTEEEEHLDVRGQRWVYAPVSIEIVQ